MHSWFDFLLMALFLSIFPILFYLIYLAVKIERYRNGEVFEGFWKEVWLPFCLTGGIISFYKGPIPFSVEPNDAEEIVTLIRRRNWYVGFFWAIFILMFILVPANEKTQSKSVGN